MRGWKLGHLTSGPNFALNFLSLYFFGPQFSYCKIRGLKYLKQWAEVSSTPGAESLCIHLELRGQVFAQE